MKTNPDEGPVASHSLSIELEGDGSLPAVLKTTRVTHWVDTGS
jgi:hypothetical protein